MSDIFDEATCGIIGINENLEVFGRYDEPFPEATAIYKRPDMFEDTDPDYELEKTEKLTLANTMIGRWKAY